VQADVKKSNAPMPAGKNKPVKNNEAMMAMLPDRHSFVKTVGSKKS